MTMNEVQYLIDRTRFLLKLHKAGKPHPNMGAKNWNAADYLGSFVVLAQAMADKLEKRDE
jgi:hypothetical protein